MHKGEWKTKIFGILEIWINKKIKQKQNIIKIKKSI